MPDSLPITGERTVPGVWHENYWFRRHEVVYAWVVDRVSDEAARARTLPDVLDAGCGEGYGTALLAQAGRPRAGPGLRRLDGPHLAPAYPGLPAVRANLVALPLAHRHDRRRW